MRRTAKEQLPVREISREVFAKFKRVRQMQSDLLGNYQLYSKNGLKYVGKQLPIDFQLSSARNPLYPIFKHSSLSAQNATYLFPLHGEPLTSLFTKSAIQGQIKRWLQRCGSLEGCLLEVVRKMLEAVEVGQQEVVLECLRVHNGEVEYCYDSWMAPTACIVLANPNEFENYYFSQEDLDQLKELSLPKDKAVTHLLVPSKNSVIFRIILMVLHLGSHNLKERNYEFGGYRLHQEHLKLRLDYFCSRHNQKGLGDLVRKVITGESIQMEQIWKICMPEIAQGRVRKTLTLSNTNISKVKRRNQTEASDYEAETPIKHSHINRLNCSIYSHSSNKSAKEDDSNLSHSLHKSTLINDQNRSRNKPIVSKENVEGSKNKKNIKLKKSSSKDSKEIKQYHLFSSTVSSKQKLNLKAVLSALTQIPKNNIRILKHFRLEEYLPQSLYEQKIIQVLSNIHIKNNWRKEVYENGSIYLGQMVQNKKEGKGIYLFNSNDFYFGDWSANFMEGYGTYIFTSGQVYQGQLRRGFKEGHGQCVYPDGKFFEGFWSKNNKVGLGKVKFPNEVIFIGLFKPDCPETEGVFLGPIEQNQKPLWENKGILEHYHWQRNTLVESKAKKQDIIDRKSKLKHCKTEYYSQFADQNGGVYEGEMVEGKKEGFGIYETTTDIYEGEWCEDKKYGSGTLLLKNLFHVSGEWKNNMLVRYDYDEKEEML